MMDEYGDAHRRRGVDGWNTSEIRRRVVGEKITAGLDGIAVEMLKNGIYNRMVAGYLR